MPFEPKPKATVPTAAEVRRAATQVPAVRVASDVPATSMTNAQYRERYLSEIAPVSIAGVAIKFTKDGVFTRQDNGEEISENCAFAGLCDEVLHGRIKFNGPGMPPDPEMGLLYSDYRVPARETLGDLDQSKWEIGLNGKPQDPWQEQLCLPLQDLETKEMFTFVTGSATGRRAVGNLLRNYERIRAAKPDHIPVVKLAKGGFNHKDSRVGWVPTPVFVTMTTMPRDGAPDPRAPAADEFNDELPPNMKDSF